MKQGIKLKIMNDSYYDEDDDFTDERTPLTSAAGGIHGSSSLNRDDHHNNNNYKPALREYNLCIKIRHSKWYFIFNLFVLVLTTLLVVWVVRSKGHNPRSRLFFLTETIVTFAVVADVVLEIAYDGWRSYFLINWKPVKSGQTTKCLVYFNCLSNWFQFLVMILCIIALLVYAISPDLPDAVLNTTADGGGDTLVSFSLLLIRYTFYVFFILISSGKTLKNRGCCENKEHWEIPEVDIDDMDDDDEEDIVY